MHITKINKILRNTICLSLTTNIAVLGIDYFTRNSSDNVYTTLANVLTLALIISLTTVFFILTAVLLKARGNVRVIERSTWILLACWLSILIATLPIEGWITGQSYRRGA